ncbi:glycerol kinase GlpK [Camelimonas abortus]|uniref:Glycerol kinase n=1 Tax=Camelimonas abortus TaxID=1017184 RepID=A0ABV7LG12_9HYPH
MREFVGAIDQGTTSSRFIIFNRRGEVAALAQQEHRQIYPGPGMVEHDAMEIWRNVCAVAERAMRAAGVGPRDLAAVGLTNQRETTLLWDRRTGEPAHNALVWQDARVNDLVAAYAKEGGKDRLREATGLPLASYFSGLKLRWLLDHAPGARARAEAGELMFGNIDAWLAWRLTGGPDGGLHVTDVTNASRTQLMNLRTLQWDPDILALFGIPAAVLPRIVPSSRLLGEIRDGPLAGAPLAGVLGDQQAALFGQACLAPGDIKNTYGTGCFMLMNTGDRPVTSRSGLLTTVAYQLDGAPPVYALEGSIAITGALVQWLRDNLGFISSSEEVERLALAAPDNGDVYFVPAFSGLYAPYWREDARGVIVGLTRFANKAHIARAALEATAFQTHDVLAAMREDSGLAVTSLRADGGMVANELLMQFQADLIGAEVVRPVVTETTALGAAYAAGLAVGYWSSPDEIVANWRADRAFRPQLAQAERGRLLRRWRQAVQRSLDWVETA